MEIKAKKSFGQNFLINKDIQNQIVEVAHTDNEDVIEIGPGLGALTNLLINKVKSLKAYELDNEIYKMWLSKELPDNILFFNQDFLDANLKNDKKAVVIGNIPYNITSPIIFKLIENFQYLKHAVIMVQKEVGERLMASINSKEYSKLSVSIQSIAEVKKVLIVKAHNFNPIPKVDSMVVKIIFNKKIDFNLKEYLDFIKLCFQFKRKTLLNNLLTKYEKNKIELILFKNNIDLKARAENLKIEEFKTIFNEFSK
ncbi:16S rRNA (adenine(1518)-N(6)/adenine(1519)-N(6))-dimethyltransferase RsmA [Metamycoplasma auris]|uniref:Ribosomal RNA small subunit methyltransferase A n=1 Tax=Metamycoplasma auris TaxID=51363 RepID=A0A2W7G6F2_9BACT|nr:16S rRNA (adenine(1518)-N(6)/adenine(1519)-N(6))-dimethyltransferase RsmA [Metamycoplasma auris]PZW01514.1 dimethyladenosine transferase [Metamycoplasma auris]